MIIMISEVNDYFVLKKNSFYIFLNKDKTEKIIDLLYIYIYTNYILYVIAWFNILISAKNLNKICDFCNYFTNIKKLMRIQV